MHNPTPGSGHPRTVTDAPSSQPTLMIGSCHHDLCSCRTSRHARVHMTPATGHPQPHARSAAPTDHPSGRATSTARNSVPPLTSQHHPTHRLPPIAPPNAPIRTAFPLGEPTPTLPTASTHHQPSPDTRRRPTHLTDGTPCPATTPTLPRPPSNPCPPTSQAQGAPAHPTGGPQHHPHRTRRHPPHLLPPHPQPPLTTRALRARGDVVDGWCLQLLSAPVAGVLLLAREGDHEGSVDVSDGDGVGAVRPRFLWLVFAAAGGCVGWFGCRLCCGRGGVCRTGCCGGGLPRPASTAFCSAPSVAGSAALGCGWLRCAGAHPSVVSLGVWVCVGGSSLLAAVGGGLGGLLAVMVVRVFKPGCWCFTGGR